MLLYYLPYYDGKNWFSVDNVRLDLEFFSSHASERFCRWLDDSFDCFTYYPSFKDFHYRHLFNFGFRGLSFTLGIRHNSTKASGSVKGFLDFNPNKLFGQIEVGDGFVRVNNSPFNDCETFSGVRERLADVFRAVFKRLSDDCIHVSLKRWDLAVDVPVIRSEVCLSKDRRAYKQFYNSREDFTEYLGSSDSPGRVKVYNKMLEAELDYDLTRVELTLGSLDFNECLLYWPEVYLINHIPLDSDKFVVSVFRELPADRLDFYVRRISDRRTKSKYKSLLIQERFQVPETAFDSLVLQLKDYIV